MDITKAKKILSLDDNYTQIELISAYKKNIEENNINDNFEDQNESFSESANRLYDISSAYLFLSNTETK